MLKVLICSASEDEHVLVAVKLLQSFKVQVDFFQTDKIGSQCNLKYDTDKGSYVITVDGVESKLDEYTSIWVRKPFTGSLKELEMTREQQVRLDYKIVESRSLFNSMLLAAKDLDILVINDVVSGFSAQFKCTQLIKASQVGFKVPKTIMSSNKVEIEKFINSVGGHCVIKTIGNHAAFWRDRKDGELMTHRITQEFFANYYKNNELDYVLYLQEEILKKYELRITVVGNKIFPCRINSQKHSESSLDWRWIDPEQMEHEMVKLPAAVEESCFNLCRSYGLQYGAIDMAVTDNEDYIFFEINPAGQYMWIDELAGSNISESIADLLMHPDKYRLA